MISDIIARVNLMTKIIIVHYVRILYNLEYMQIKQ